LQKDHIFRMFSSTKLVTSCAVLMLFEQERIQWDDPIEAYIPELGARQVLKQGATRIDDVEPARTPITIRHLMTHTSGSSYGVFDPGTVTFNAYRSALVMHPGKTLSENDDPLWRRYPLLFILERSGNIQSLLMFLDVLLRLYLASRLASFFQAVYLNR